MINRNFYLDPLDFNGAPAAPQPVAAPVITLPTETPTVKAPTMSVLSTILANIEKHGALISQAITLVDTKIANAEAAVETAAENAIENSPLVAQIEAAFSQLEAQTTAFLAKHSPVATVEAVAQVAMEAVANAVNPVAQP